MFDLLHLIAIILSPLPQLLTFGSIGWMAFSKTRQGLRKATWLFILSLGAYWAILGFLSWADRDWTGESPIPESQISSGWLALKRFWNSFSEFPLLEITVFEAIVAALVSYYRLTTMKAEVMTECPKL